MLLFPPRSAAVLHSSEVIRWPGARSCFRIKRRGFFLLCDWSWGRARLRRCREREIIAHKNTRWQKVTVTSIKCVQCVCSCGSNRRACSNKWPLDSYNWDAPSSHTHTHTKEHFSNLGKSSAIWNFPDTNRIVQMRQTLHECKIGCKQRLPYIWFLTDLVLSLRISLNIPNVWPHSVKFRDFRLSPPRWVTPQKLICQSTWLGFNQSCFLLLSNKSTYSDDSLSVNEPSAQKKKKKKKY